MLKDDSLFGGAHPFFKTEYDKHLNKSAKYNKTKNYLKSWDVNTHIVVTGQVSKVFTEPNLELRVRLDDSEFFGECTASLPSTVPTGPSKSISIPQIGQRFTGVLKRGSNHVNITSFHTLMSDVGEEGALPSIENVGDGDTKFKAAGNYDPTIILKEEGIVKMSSGTGSLEIDGGQAKINIIMKEKSEQYLGGQEFIDFNQVFTMTPPFAPALNTSTYTWVQGKNKDLNMATDTFNSTESMLTIPGPGEYVDKVVVRAGLIPGDMPIQDMGHIYELSTRQKHTPPLTPYLPGAHPITTGKSCTTELKLGKQNQSNQNLSVQPGGSILQWRVKDIWADGFPASPNPQVFSMRFGKRGSDPLAAATGYDEGGEIFHIRVGYGGGPVGMAAVSGGGKGYDRSLMTSPLSQAFEMSFGNSGTDPTSLVDLDYGNTYYRLRAKSSGPTDVLPNLQDAHPGAGDYKFTLGHGFGGESLHAMKEELTGNYPGIGLGLGAIKYERVINAQIPDPTGLATLYEENISAHTALATAPSLVKLTKVLDGAKYDQTLQLMEGAAGTAGVTLDLTPAIGSTKLGFESGAQAGSIEISPTSVTITNTITPGALDNKIVMDAQGITMTTGSMSSNCELKMGFGGVTINGHHVVTHEFLDWLLSNAASIGVNSGGPVQVFPSAAAELVSKTLAPDQFKTTKIS